jgi:hypothetical protein
MTTSLPSRTVTVLALILSMATAGVLLAPAPRAVGQGRNPACPASSATHQTRGAHACAQAKRPSKSSHKGKAHRHSKGKGHHYKHASATTKPGAAPGKSTKASPAGAGQSPATCENGSVPVRTGDGYFSCGDESEPACPNGSTPALSKNGSTLQCSAEPGREPGRGATPAEATCEDGSAPVMAGDGSFSCDDESAPGCENGSVPTLSSDRSTLVCNVVPSGKPS